jgi:hypothetical protein
MVLVFLDRQIDGMDKGMFYGERIETAKRDTWIQNKKKKKKKKKRDYTASQNA